jgi:valacyclovir hydrolase
MPFVDVATGVRLHYEDRGAGEPFILVHGMLGSAIESFSDVMDWLAPNYHIMGLALRGYGQSTPKPRDFPLGFYHRDAEDVLSFMDALHISRAHILGFSDGGESAMIAAALQPDRFKSVTTIGAVGHFGPELRPVVQRIYPGDWISDEELAMHGIPSREQFTLAWVTAMKHYIDSGGDVSLSMAHQITSPMLLMLGDQDTLNPESYGRRYIERTPNGRIAMFHSGHAVHQEQWPEFQRVMSEFLKSVE